METQQKITYGILTLIIIYTILGTGEPTHYCESREIKVNCLRLSSTNKTCYNIDKGFRCLDGWKEIPFEIEPEAKPKNIHSGRLEACGPRGTGCKPI